MNSTPAVNFLGYVIEDGQVKADPEKIKTVTEWPKPETVSTFQGFWDLLISTSNSSMSTEWQLL